MHEGEHIALPLTIFEAFLKPPPTDRRASARRAAAAAAAAKEREAARRTNVLRGHTPANALGAEARRRKGEEARARERAKHSTSLAAKKRAEQVARESAEAAFGKAKRNHASPRPKKARRRRKRWKFGTRSLALQSDAKRAS